jgi:hypothetical protein
VALKTYRSREAPLTLDQRTVDSECAESVPLEHRDLVLSVADGMVVFGFELQDGRIIAITELYSGISPGDQDGVRCHFMRHFVGERRIHLAVMQLPAANLPSPCSVPSQLSMSTRLTGAFVLDCDVEGAAVIDSSWRETSEALGTAAPSAPMKS